MHNLNGNQMGPKCTFVSNLGINSYTQKKKGNIKKLTAIQNQLWWLLSSWITMVAKINARDKTLNPNSLSL